jgi:hypothetical protein
MQAWATGERKNINVFYRQPGGVQRLLYNACRVFIMVLRGVGRDYDRSPFRPVDGPFVSQDIANAVDDANADRVRGTLDTEAY